jgi:peroxiredoxin
MAVIAINVGFNDSIEAIRSYRKQLGITMPIVFDDGSLGTAFHVRVTPTHIIIGRDGRIRYVGHLANAELDAALIAARAPASREPHAAAVASTDPAPISVGDRLPKMSLRTIDGQRFELGRGGTPRTGTPRQELTALIFLSPWCESYLATTRPQVSANCRSAREQSSALASEPHLRWLGVASGLWANSDDLRKYREQYKVSIPLTLDASGEVFRAFRVNDVPTVLIADAGGRIVRRIEGDAARDPAALRTALALAGNSR